MALTLEKPKRQGSYHRGENHPRWKGGDLNDKPQLCNILYYLELGYNLKQHEVTWH